MGKGPVPLLDVSREPRGPELGGEPEAPPCRVVFINESSRGERLPFYQVVARGVHGRVEILYASPPRCVLVPQTRIEYRRSCKYTLEELRNNYLIVEECGKRRSRYAYPKQVWRELYNLYIRPLTEGEKPYNTGVILYGPPGTGKSRLAKLVAGYVGVNVYDIDTSIISMYIGETERRLVSTISDAIDAEPSIIILDDAEWLLASRKLAGEAGEGAYGSVRQNLQQLLFKWMQYIYDEEKRVLFIATTNYKKEALDPALMRHGRFGPPILVPLPDKEALMVLFHDLLPDKSDEYIERLARTAVNAGLSIADAIGLAERVRMGEEPKPRTVGGRGYARIYVDEVPEFRRLEEAGARIPLRVILSRRSRLYVGGPEEAALAAAIQIAYAAERTVIRLVDPRELDEAIHTANVLGSVLLVPTRLDPAIQYYVVDNSDTSIVFYGEKPPAPAAFPLGDVISIVRATGPEALVKAAAAMIGEKADDKLLAMVRRKAAGDPEVAVRTAVLIAVTGTARTEHVEPLLAWM